MTVKRVAFVYPTSKGEHDAIQEYAIRLTGELGRLAGYETAHVDVRQLAAASEWADVMLLQYNPFSFGRWGFAPDLLRAWRRADSKTRLAVMVHEPFVPMKDLRSALMGLWQRAQLTWLLRASDLSFVSIDGWRRRSPWLLSESHLLPVPAALPQPRGCRRATRSRHGIGEQELVVATLSSGHPSLLVDHIRAAVSEVGAHRPAVHLNLGYGADPLSPVPGIREIRPGYLEPSVLSDLLATCDLCLFPFVDGISTRRTSFMNALQAGVATVATDGPLTSTALRHAAGDAWVLAPAQNEEAFARAAVRLAVDPHERRRVGARGSELYSEHFAWPVLLERLASLLEA